MQYSHLGNTVSTWAVQSVPGQYSQYLGSTVTLAVQSVPGQYSPYLGSRVSTCAVQSPWQYSQYLGSTVSTWVVVSTWAVHSPWQYSQYLDSTVTLAVQSVPEQCRGHPPALPLHHQLLDLGLQNHAGGRGGVSHHPHLPPAHTPAPLSQSTARGSSRVSQVQSYYPFRCPPPASG